MFTSKLFFLTIVLMTCVLSVFGRPETDEADPCLITRKCSTTEDIVWATDDNQCYLFRNPCIFGTDSCRRKKANESVLNIVTKEVCKEKCSSFCTADFSPVCAEYDNAVKTFSNKCAFYGTSCQEEKSYMFVHDGECAEAVAA